MYCFVVKQSVIQHKHPHSLHVAIIAIQTITLQRYEEESARAKE